MRVLQISQILTKTGFKIYWFLEGIVYLSEEPLLYKGIGDYQFEEVPVNFFNIDLSEIEIFDIDGDGDQDIFLSGYITNNSKRTVVYKNNGNFSFSIFNSLISSTLYCPVVKSFDADNDGDLDLFLNTESGTNSIYLNDGAGLYSSLNLVLPDATEMGIDFGDINGDGKIDFVYSGADNNGNIESYSFININGTSFTELSNPQLGRFYRGDIKLVDVDSDNDLDAVMSGLSNGTGSRLSRFVGVSKNNGSGVFTSFFRKTVSVDDVELNVIDFDLDGDVDILYTNKGDDDSYFGRLLKNDGIGNFTFANSQIPSSAYSRVALGDLDNDSDLDLYISYSSLGKLYNYILINNGSAKYTKWGPIEDFARNLGNIKPADVDNDGDLDVYLSDVNSEISILFKNDGLGNLTLNTTSSLNNIGFGSAIFFDVDNDGDKDFISSDVNTIYLMINDGNGIFNRSTSFTPTTGLGDGDIDFGDLNGDGYIDFIISGQDNTGNNELKVYINSFTTNTGFSLLSNTNLIGVAGSDLKLGDFDNDNDLDLVVIGTSIYSSSQPVLNTEIYHNDGSGIFSRVNANLDNITDGAIDIADMDGDSDLDILITGTDINDMGQSFIYRNNGNLSFSKVNLIGNSNFFRGDCKFSDVDADGDSDIILTGSINQDVTGSKTSIYVNDGLGIYRLAQTPIIEGGYRGHFISSDLNGDNYPELILAGFNSNGDYKLNYYINNNCESKTIISTNLCSKYTSPSGKIFENSGTYLDTLINSNGCDSIITINFTRTFLNTEVADSSFFLTSQATNVFYQWLDCGNNFSQIANENQSVFHPEENGVYAVEISKGNSCKDTSDCYDIIRIGIDNYKTQQLKLFPNPSTGNFTINLSEKESNVNIIIFDSRGSLVFTEQVNHSNEFLLETNLAEGIYHLQLTSNDQLYHQLIEIIK